MAGTRFYKAEAADGRFVDNSELAQALEPYARKTDVPEPQDLSGYALKEDIPGAPDLSSYALKSQIPGPPDLSGYETSAHAEATYQPRGDYATVSQVDQKVAAAIPDLSGYVQDADLDGYAKKTDIPDVSGFQPRGDYALKSDIPDGTVLVLGPSDEVPAGTPAGTVIVRRAA